MFFHSPAYTVPIGSYSHHETNIKVQVQELEECNYKFSLFKQLKLPNNICYCYLNMRFKYTTTENESEAQQRHS